MRVKHSFFSHPDALANGEQANAFVVAFARYLTDRRHALRLTQTEIARAVGVSNSMLCRWEMGRTPPPNLTNAARWAGALGLTFPTAATGAARAAAAAEREDSTA